MKRQLMIAILILTALCLLLPLPFSSHAQSKGYIWPGPKGWSIVSVIAHCSLLNIDTSVSITIGRSSLGHRTPYTFAFPNGTQSITVPYTDTCGHPFTEWSTGETTPTITVSSGGTYVAYYGGYSSSLLYNVFIDTALNGEGDVNINITKDGHFTGFTAPHNFAGLRGIHNFTVPSVDSNGHKFSHWISPSGSQINFTTIIVLSGGKYTACYDVGLCRYVTPSDPKVAAAASKKSWTELLDYVSSQIAYGNNANWQMPNETLTLGAGQCRDYATLYVSMLRAQGYTAYVAVGTTNHSGTVTGHAWAVFKIKETFIHVEPQWNAYNQKFVNFTAYQSEYYFDEKGIVSSVVSENPPLFSSRIDKLIIYSAVLSAIVLAISACKCFIWRGNSSEVISEKVGQLP